MRYLEWLVIGVGFFFALTFAYGIRVYTKNGRPPQTATITTAMLMTISLIVILSTHRSAFHLLWLIPTSWAIGTATTFAHVSMRLPFVLFRLLIQPIWILANIYGLLCCLGIDWNEARRKQAIVESQRKAALDEYYARIDAETGATAETNPEAKG